MMKIHVLYGGIADMDVSYNSRHVFARIFVSLKPKQLFVLFFYCEFLKFNDLLPYFNSFL